MPMRARWPPENWCGKRRISVGSSPTRFSCSPTYSTCCCGAMSAVRDRRLADDVDDAHARVERRVRILEDHLHLELLPARGFAGASAGERRAAPEALAGGQRQQPDGEAAERRLAAARFADQADDLAAARCAEIDAVDGVHDLLAACRRRAALPIRAARSSDLTKRFETPRSSTSAAPADAASAVPSASIVSRSSHHARHVTAGVNGWWQRVARAAAGCADRRASAGIVAHTRSRARTARGTRSRAAGRAATASCRESASGARRARCATAPNRASPACTDARGRVSTS